MRFRYFALAAVIMLFAAATANAALSRANEEWAKGPAQHLMTRDELRQWKSINSDADAQAFIDLFWARRDATPATPRNEFRDEFEARVKAADEQFKEGGIRGSMTDRGKTLILLGVPTRRTKRTETAPMSGLPTDDPTTTAGSRASGVTEIWVYEGARVPDFVNSPRFEVHFRDEFGNGRYRAARSTMNLSELWQKAAQQAMVSPNLQAPPTVTQPTTQPTPAPQPVAPASPVLAQPATAFKTQSLQAAFTDFKAAKTSPYKDVFVTYGEFVTPAGDYFIPVQVYMTKSPGAEVDRPVTFFGVVEDPAGQIVGVFEEPVTLQATRTEFFADKSIRIPAGKYTGTFGIALDGKPLAMARTNLELAPLTQEQSSISRLILSNNIFPLKVAQLPTDPFAFGGIKVVPKGDRVFTRQDELWYFFELRNPGVDETGKPKVQVKVDVEAKSGQKMGAPLAEVPAEPLKGVPGHFGVGSAIPLAGFSPGDYTIKLRVIDTIKKQTYNLQETFRVTG